MAASRHKRLDRVFRRWQLARRRREARSPLRPEQLAFLIGIVSAPLLNGLAAELWGQSLDPWVEHPVLGGIQLGGVLLVIAGLQALYANRSLRSVRWRERHSLIRRTLLAAAPLVGLGTLLPWGDVFPPRRLRPQYEIPIAPERSFARAGIGWFGPS